MCDALAARALGSSPSTYDGVRLSSPARYYERLRFLHVCHSPPLSCAAPRRSRRLAFNYAFPQHARVCGAMNTVLYFDWAAPRALDVGFFVLFAPILLSLSAYFLAAQRHARRRRVAAFMLHSQVSLCGRASGAVVSPLYRQHRSLKLGYSLNANTDALHARTHACRPPDAI